MHVKLRYAVAIVALIVTVFVVRSPAARQLLVFQIRQVFVTDYGSYHSPVTYEEVVRAHPDDLQIQLAAADTVLYGLPSDSSFSAPISTFASLEHRFPNQPTVYANILRWMTEAGPDNDRPESSLAIGNTPVATNGGSTSEFPYTFYDSTAVEGEKLDPGNAYFPIMRCIGLFGQRRDADALAELHKASLDEKWYEYYEDEVQGKSKISDLRGGGIVGLNHTFALFSTVFPHYQRLHYVTKIVLYKAMIAEHAGHTAQGISLRRDLIQCGSLMRCRSSSTIGSLMGTAIFTYGISNPGGTVKKYGFGKSTERLRAYCSYLDLHGYGALIPSIKQEYDSGEQATQIDSGSLRVSLLMNESFTAAIAYGLALLAAIVSLLLISGITSLVACCFRISNVAYRVLAAGSICILIVLLCRVVYLQVGQMHEDDEIDFFCLQVSKWMAFIFFGGVLVPLAGSVIASAVMNWRGQEASKGLRLSGIGQSMASIACVLLLVNGVVIWKTVQMERVVDDEYTRSLTNTGVLDADLIGQVWPGPTNWPSDLHVSSRNVRLTADRL